MNDTRLAFFVLGIGFLVLAGLAWYGTARPNSSDSLPPPTVQQPTGPATIPPMPNAEPFSIASPAFDAGAAIPQKFTCDGTRSLSPALTIRGIPDGARSLVLIMDDPDVPTALIPEGLFVHWVLYNIPPTTTSIPEGGTAGSPGGNGRDDLAYTGPCPPPDYEPSTHRYFFKLYALSEMLSFSSAPTKADVEAAMVGKVIAEAELIGTYSRK